MTPPRGVGDAAPYSGNPVSFSSPLPSFYGKKFAATGAKIAVIMPATAIARPLMAPSISPICRALLVPIACADVPSAKPFASGSVMRQTLPVSYTHLTLPTN